MKTKEMYAALGTMRHRIDQQTWGQSYYCGAYLQSLLRSVDLIDHGLWIGLGRKNRED